MLQLQHSQRIQSWSLLDKETKNSVSVLQNLPFYRIFAADSRYPRDGRHLENVGHYNPIPGETSKMMACLKSTFRHWYVVQSKCKIAELKSLVGRVIFLMHRYS